MVPDAPAVRDGRLVGDTAEDPSGVLMLRQRYRTDDQVRTDIGSGLIALDGIDTEYPG